MVDNQQIYVINHLKLVYLPVPKVASTSFKQFFGYQYEQRYITFPVDYDIMFICRNPIERLVSLYNNKINTTEFRFNQTGIYHCMPFDEFVGVVCDTNEDEITENYLLPQHKFYNKWAYKYKLEELDEWWPQICSRYKFTNHRIPHVKRTNNMVVPQSLQKMITDRYEKDFELFRYD